MIKNISTDPQLYQVFVQKLLTWYPSNARDLPWRHTQDPYLIWLSEVILQQTRVAQGLPYYLKFVENFPTVIDLAKADEQTVLKLWQGLGYYSRALNLHYAAKQVMTEFSGVFPSAYKDLIQLKGVGAYTAAAISSFSSGEAVPVVDGNVYRVLARVFGLDDDIKSTQGAKSFNALAEDIMHHAEQDQAGQYNQSIMEFGALHCTPAKPMCTTCPMKWFCYAYLNNKVDVLPVSIKKVKIKDLKIQYYYCLTEDGLFLKQRDKSDIWKGLFEMPTTTQPALGNTELQRRLLSLLNTAPYISMSFQHKLTHKNLTISFFGVDETHWKEMTDLLQMNGYQFYSEAQLSDLPVPLPISKFLKQNFGI